MTNSAENQKNLISTLSALWVGQPVQTRLVPTVRVEEDGIFISLKVGRERLYSVKDFAEFIKVLQTGETIKFSKNYTFNSSKAEFSKEVLGFLNLMTVIVTENAKSGREYQLPTKYIPQVFEQLANIKTEIYAFGQRSKDPKIIWALPEMDFDILRRGEYVVLRCNGFDGIKPIVDDFKVLYKDGIIYLLKPAQKAILKQIFSSLVNGSVLFNEEDKYDLITKVLPHLRRVGRVHIDSDIKKDVTIGTLKIKTFLDRAESGGIAATVRFCYGGVEFNHFAGEKPDTKGKILIREFRKENEFIRLAGDFGFLPENGVLYLLDEYKIYDFLTDGIFKMKEMSEVFYSDRFNIEVITPTKANGGVSLSSGNILEFSLSLEGTPDEEIAEIMQAVKEKRKFYHLKSGSFVNLATNAVKQGQKLLETLEASPDGRVNLARAFFIDGLGSGTVSIKGDNKFNEFIRSFNEKDIMVNIPEHIDKILRPYQRSGVKWMKTLAKFGMGGILADEMGLGKTLQTIAFVMSEYEIRKKPTLIVVPTSLIYNWESEIKKFAPEAKVSVVSGSPDNRCMIAKDMDKSHFVITSYGLLRNDLNLYIKQKFAYCFIDEAQHIKNPNTISSRVVKQINAENFFALTGTPLENTLLELWSVFDFVMPGYLFGRHKFREMYELPIVKEKDKTALEMLKKHISPFILRRLKSQVMSELPEKIENYLVCQLTDEQKKLYIGFAEKAKQDVISLGENGEFEKNRIKILAIITRLRQICCHPSLFIENYEGESGKLNLLKDTIESGIMAGHRILIFSQFTSMLGMISDMISEMGISHYYLDGSTKSEQRFNMVKAFNEGMCDIFLVSLKAGGTGLNLTGADMVIHYDPWWNPAVENQATDRAHRIGQTKVVQVLKLIAAGTIEEKIFDLKKLKQEMVDSVLEAGETMLSSLTFEEIKWLFQE